MMPSPTGSVSCAAPSDANAAVGSADVSARAGDAALSPATTETARMEERMFQTTRRQPVGRNFASGGVRLAAAPGEIVRAPTGLGPGDAAGHQPQVWALFCVSSQVLSGAK